MRSLRIVVADDEPALRALFGLWLTRLGHTVVAVEDGDELVEVCRTNYFDLAISDIEMGGLDGLTAAGILRRECGLPVILVSGGWTAERKSQARSVGALCLDKPLLPLTLVALVDEAGRRKVPALA